MRLVNTKELDTGNFEIKEFADDEIPQYAILSHTWEGEEVTLHDMKEPPRSSGFEYVWIDTCCIDKTSSAELSEAINSMFRWYQDAEACYAYLADVPSRKVFSDSRWFSRGWTLQELIAPSTVIFFDETWKEVGTKADHRQSISDCTGIPVSILSGDKDLETFSIAQRMSWAAERKTSRIEDRAYCLMGIFGINMPLIYGEKETAFIRLQEEIMRISDDHSLFAWKSPDHRGGLLATSPAAFHGCRNIVQFNPFNNFDSPMTVSSRGIGLELRFIGVGCRGLGLAILHCKEGGGEDKLIAIYVRDSFLTMERFERVWTEEFKLLDLRKFRPSQYPMRRICLQAGRMARMRKLKDLGKGDNIAPEEIYSDGMLTRLMNFEDPAALLRAVERGLEDIVWLLLTRSDVEASLKGEDGRTALCLAAQIGHDAIFKLLFIKNGAAIEAKDENGRTPLSWAAERGNKAIVQLLLENGAATEAEDKYGQTPLSWAAEKGSETIIQLLLENGAATEVKDRNSWTPLSWAAKRGNKAIVQLLLEKGAATEAKDENNRAPLSWAAEGGNEAIIQLLLQKGAATEAKDENGRTPLSWAAERGNEAIVQLLLEKGAAIEVKDRYGQTTLWWAIDRGNVAFVQQLLKNGAAIEANDRCGRTPLSWAAERGNKAIVQLLLENGAATEANDRCGRTPLSWAAERGNKAIVQLLLENGAAIEVRDKYGWTPLSWAAMEGNETIVQLLLENGAATDAKDKTPVPRHSFLNRHFFKSR